MVMRIKKDGTVSSEVIRIPDVIKVRLNDEEKLILDKAQQVLEQSKHSTALKQLCLIGAIVVFDQKTKKIIDTIYANKRKNKRMNIIDFE